MPVTVTLHESEAVFAVSAIEAEIEKLAKFCRETDGKFGAMNDIHKEVMRDLLSARDTIVSELRVKGYAMSRVVSYDTSLPEWQKLETRR